MGADVLVVREKEYNNNNTQYRLCTINSYKFSHSLPQTNLESLNGIT